MRPVIGVICDVKTVGTQMAQSVTEKYVFAVARGSEALALLVPGRMYDVHHELPPERVDLDELFATVDGIFLPGSPSNVDPSFYGAALKDPTLPADPHRDDLSLRLIRGAIERGVPLFGVCRGYQEMNVALGGSLIQGVQDLPGHMDHREPKNGTLDEQYAAAHNVSLTPGGLLSRLAGGLEAPVNSLHGQGVDRLAPGLTVEARAPDGLIEAFRVEGASAFALGVQWHPEWRFWADPLSTALFKAFGDAARARMAERLGLSRPVAAAE